MSDEAAAAPAAAPAAPDTAVVAPPSLEGSTAAEAIGSEANTAPGADDWSEAVAANTGMVMPTVVEDGGRLGSGHRYENQAPDAQQAPAAAQAPDAEPPPEQVAAPPAESFVARANAERQRLYQSRTAAANGEQLVQARAENARLQQHQRDSLYTAEQIDNAVRENPFAFLRERGVGLRELNERLESDGNRPKDPQSNSEVHALRQQMQQQQREVQQLRQEAYNQQQSSARTSAIDSLAQGLERFKDSYPGMHAVFGPGSGTTPAEQVMIGLQRSQQNGSNMSADEVAGRLERVARQQFSKLQNAYGSAPAAANRPPSTHQTQAPHIAAQTAGVTNAAQQPTRVPRAPMSRAEEIRAAVSLLEYK